MVTTIVTYFKNLGEVPKDIFSVEDYSPPLVRSFILGSYAYPIALAVTVIIGMIFTLLGVKWLAIFDILQAIFIIAATVIHRKGYIWQGFCLISILVMSHAAICVAVIGWDAGFQYYLIIIPLIVFLSHLTTPIKVTIATMYGFYYAALHYFLSPLTPLTTIHPSYISMFQYVNFFGLIFSLSSLGYVFSLATIRAETKLEKAHQRTNDALTERNQALTQLNEEISEAADYVKRILPSPIQEGAIRTNWRFIPSTSLGGDAFGYHKIDGEHFAVYLIDVSGHGVGAALLSISAINVLRSQSLPKTDFKDPGQVLRALNLAFPSESNKDMFLTMWYGVYNQNNRELTYSSGGHPPAILFNGNPAKDADFNLLRTPNYVVGGMTESTFTTDTCPIREHSSLYVFSDGVYEVEKPDGAMWRFQEFTDYMQKIRTDGHDVLDRLYGYVKELGNSETLEDDFTILEVAFT